ncbi:hypothetical protein [Paenibacillus sp. GYB003]|uniref:hypothetical protein n=1 Tax=Paenibacillus sp. GYB003 TaxID=2994392 RepID=UPI002F9629EF
MSKAKLAAAGAILLAGLTAAGCGQADYRMQQERTPTEDTEDTRGMRRGEHMEDRVNTNIPKGSSVPEDTSGIRRNDRSGVTDPGLTPSPEGDNVVELKDFGKPVR